MSFTRPTNLIRFSLNFALKPVAAALPAGSDCWAAAGNEKAATARQSTPILIAFIGFSPYLYNQCFFRNARRKKISDRMNQHLARPRQKQGATPAHLRTGVAGGYSTFAAARCGTAI